MSVSTTQADVVIVTSPAPAGIDASGTFDGTKPPPESVAAASDGPESMAPASPSSLVSAPRPASWGGPASLVADELPHAGLSATTAASKGHSTQRTCFIVGLQGPSMRGRAIGRVWGATCCGETEWPWRPFTSRSRPTPIASPVARPAPETADRSRRPRRAGRAEARAYRRAQPEMRGQDFAELFGRTDLS